MFGNFITIKLKPNNYPLWRKQTLVLVEGQELVDNLLSTTGTPTMHTTIAPEIPTRRLLKFEVDYYLCSFYVIPVHVCALRKFCNFYFEFEV